MQAKTQQTNLTKENVIAEYLPQTLTHKQTATAFAPSNIALCKYWGKREEELNLPINGSLSISLGNLGTTTTISVAENGIDTVFLNNTQLESTDKFAQKVFAFINLFRKNTKLAQANTTALHVNTVNTIPTAAGLASSASGFAALTLAINDFYNLSLSNNVLSAFARMGSGSASRSLYHGFVQWHKGSQKNGMDSMAEHVPSSDYWHNLRVGLVEVNLATKKIDSRTGMKRTVATSHLYEQWQSQAEQDLATIQNAISTNNFTQLGETAEHNALSMHATMISTWPPVLYWQAESVAAMHKVWKLRDQGVPVYLTMDAGPNLKLLFMAEHENAIKQTFGDLEIIQPFSVQ